MAEYVALLRGIGPGNPNMRNEKLRDCFTGLGFTNVRTVISSGNVLFESSRRSARALEAAIERALPENLGFTSTAIVLRAQQVRQFVKTDPFHGRADTPGSRLNVTFLKHPFRSKMTFPYRPKDRTFEVTGRFGAALCSVIDLSGARTPELMGWLEKQFGREITTRTWKTVNRIDRLLSAG